MTFQSVLLLASLVCFLLAAFGIAAVRKVQLLALGLAFLVASMLFVIHVLPPH